MGKTLRTLALVLSVAALAVTGVGLALGGTIVLAGTTISSAALLGIAAGVAGIGATIIGPKTPRSQLSRLNVSLDPSAPRKAVLGTTAMPLDMRYHQASGTDQAFIDYIIAVAAHKVASIDEIYFEEKLAWTAASGVTSTYNGYLTVNTRLEGASNNTIFISAGSPWDASCRLTGCAYVHIRIKRTGNSKKTESPLVQGLPSRVTIIGEGAPLYDPRLDSTVPGGSGSHRANSQATWGTYAGADDFDNPALQLLWFLLGWKINGKLSIGAGVPPERIDLQSFITAANICDENVALATSGTQKRYRTSGTVSDEDGRMDAINTFLACMNGTLRDNGGKLTLALLKNDLADPVLDFTDGDFLGEFAWDQTGGGLSQSHNVIRGRYVDPSTQSLYQLVEYPQIALESPDGIERVMTFDLPFVEDGRRAQRLAKQVLQRHQFRGQLSAEFTAKALGCEVGHIVTITLTPLGFSGKPFRVIAKEIRPDGRVPMTLLEESPLIYQWDQEDVAPVAARTPVVYDPLLNMITQGDDEASTTANWSGIIDDNGNLPEDNATFGATIPLPGSGVAGNVKDNLGQIYDPGELLNSQMQLTASGQLQYRPLPSLEPVPLGSVNIVDLGGATELAMRRSEDDIDQVASALAVVINEASQTRQTFTDAGFYVDPATGTVRIHAVDVNSERVNEAEIRLDSAESAINLRATTTYVDQAILNAVIDPSQIAELDTIFFRLTAAEVDIDGLQATVTTLATVTELSLLAGRVTTAESEINALEGTITTKVDTTEFTALESRVTTAETTLTAIGDTAQIVNAVTAVRVLEREQDVNLQTDLRTILQGDRNQRNQVEAIADARQELTAQIIDGDTAEAAARLALAVRVSNAESSIVSESTTRATADSALSSQITVLTSTVNDNTAAIQTESTTRATADSTLASQISVLEAGFEGELANTNASVVAESQARATADSALAGRATALEATVNSGTTGNAALQARIAAEETARATADSALASRATALEATVNSGTTGNAALQARIASEEVARANGDAAEASARSALTAVVNTKGRTFRQTSAPTATAVGDLWYDSDDGNRLRRWDGASWVETSDTRIDANSAAITTEQTARANGDSALAGQITSLTTTVNSNTATLTTFGESINGLSARQGVRLDVNGRITGFVQNNDGSQGDFNIVADNFRVIDPDTGAAFIDADENGLRLRNGRVIMDNGIFIRATGVGFGTSGQFIEWFGPRPTGGNLALCNEANAISYLKTNGDAFFGGTLSAGVLRNAARTTSILADATVTVGPFGTNGNPIVVITSYALQSGFTDTYEATNQALQQWDADVIAWGAVAQGGGGFRTVDASKNITCNVVAQLQRALGDTAPSAFATLTITGGIETLTGIAPTPGDAPGNLVYTRTVSGSITSTDNTGGVQNRTFIATLTARTDAVIGTVQTQTLGITATEE